MVSFRAKNSPLATSAARKRAAMVQIAKMDTRMGGRHGKRGGGHGGGKLLLGMADANKDGAVTQAEFTAAHDQHFAMIDANKDGSISADERKAARAKMREQMRSLRGGAAAPCEPRRHVTAEVSIRLLLVDDEPGLREPLAAYLVRQGFAVTEAASAAEARARLLESTPDLVLLDIMMPGEDGLSLCRHLAETRAIPTILLTAKGEATDRIVGLEIGADDYVTKPFEPRELVARIRSVLRRATKSAAPWRQTKFWSSMAGNSIRSNAV